MQEVQIARLHLLEGKPISTVYDPFGRTPTGFYRQQKEQFGRRDALRILPCSL